MVTFGIDRLLAPGLIAGLNPAGTPRHFFWVYFTAASFIAAAVSIAFRKYVRLGKDLVGNHVLFVALEVSGCALAVAVLRILADWQSAGGMPSRPHSAVL